MSIRVLLTCLGLALPLRAENYLSYLGGGGEPKASTTTMFDDNLKDLNTFSSENKNWNLELKFNGGHTATEALMSSGFQSASAKKPFEKSSLKETIESYTREINSGKIKSGDQLLVMINSHGGAATDASKSHLITAGAVEGVLNTQTLAGATGVVNLDQLQDLITLANTKGIKLGIIDFSCHSGNSLKLANEKTCVISAAGPEHFSFTVFASDFTKNMKAGKSLEQIFLETRLSTADTSYPMISTAAGQEINAKLYPKLSPYLNYDADQLKAVSRKLSDYVQLAAGSPQLCNNDENLLALKRQLEELKQSMSAQANLEAASEIDKLAALVTAYKIRLDAKIEEARKLGAVQFHSKEKISLSGNGSFKDLKGTLSHDFTISELLETDYDKVIKGVETAFNESVRKSIFEKTRQYDQQNADYDAALNLHKQARTKQQQLIKEFPKLKEYRTQFRAAMKDLTETSFRDVAEIAKQEKKTYDLWYKSKPKKTEACGEFVL